MDGFSAYYVTYAVVICLICPHSPSGAAHSHAHAYTSSKSPPHMLHVIAVIWARVVCLICTPEAQGPQAQGLRVYISGKCVHMLQLLCDMAPPTDKHETAHKK